MHEQATSNWAVRLYSLFEPTNFLSFLPNVSNERAVRGSWRYSDDAKVRDTGVLVGYLVLFWMMLHLLYEKCLNSLFRRMGFPLIQRGRIIQAAWYCGFCFGSICYMKSSTIQILSFAAVRKQGMTYQQLGVALHKSFYLHQAGIDVTCRGAWIKGCANLLFASVILNPYQLNYRWCIVTGIFLMYRTIDIVMINICRILLCVFQTVGKPICKLLVLAHCLIWIYLYLYHVPVFMLWSEEVNHGTGMELGLWLWFIAECLDSILLRFIRHAKATYWLEISLFPPPTREAIELAGIHKRHGESLRKSSNKVNKVQLWQTLVCAMAIKKKIKRLRQTKSNVDSSRLDDSEEMELFEMRDVKNETAESESKDIRHT